MTEATAGTRLQKITSQIAPKENKEPFTLSTHVLNTASGRPGDGMSVRLETKQKDGSFKSLSSHTTNEDGRVKDFPRLSPGIYKLTFATEEYCKKLGLSCFYPQVQVEFRVEKGSHSSHYHVPLLISPFGFSTYRGS
jgi:5-hydroxyisourate hydrolase